MHTDLPIIATTDCIIMGGTSAAVACALALKQAGVRVQVCAPRPYFGEDIGANFRYWPEQRSTLSDGPGAALVRRVFTRADGPMRPMEVKDTLAQALVAADIPVLLGAQAAGVLHDEHGVVSGVVIGNRAGYQVVQARCVVDATLQGVVAEQAGCGDARLSGTQRCEHIAVGGQAPEGAGLDVVALAPFSFSIGKKDFSLPAWRVHADCDCGDGGWQALAQAQAALTDRCWAPGRYQFSEQLAIVGEATVSEQRAPGLWRCTGTDPVAAMAAGAAMAAHIESDVAQRAHATAASLVYAAGASTQPIQRGELRVLDQGLRPGDTISDRVSLDINAVPLLGSWDVVVIGGGTGGAPAAVAAARAQASVLCAENMPILGGVGTAGQIAKYWYGNRVGFTSEVDEAVGALESDAIKVVPGKGWTPGAKQQWYHRECHRLGVDLWYGTVCVGAWMDDNRVIGVLLAGPYGFGLVAAGAVVDGTGNADVAAAAGAQTTGIGADHMAVQGTGLAGMRSDRPYNNSDHSFSDDSDVVDATQFLISSAHKYNDHFDAGQLIDSRERRQIIGDARLTPLDFLAHRTFPDTICRSISNFDTHGFTIHPLFFIEPMNEEAMEVDVPYRALLPQGLEGVIVTGLGLSAQRDALPVVRMQPDVQNHGYAAGYAAALVARAQNGFRDVDIRALQRHLVAIGNLSERVLSDVDSFPVADERLQWAVAEGAFTHEGVALCFAHPERAKELLQAAMPQADDAHRERYAMILAHLGSDLGADILATVVAQTAWDAGWNYTGMGQFGRSSSALDDRIIALGTVAGAPAWEVLFEKVATLPDNPEFSHCRALSLAWERLYPRHQHDDAARKLLAVLQAEGVAGHALTTQKAIQAQLTADSCETDVRNRSLREIHLARACWRSGDASGISEAILRQYADDLRGAFARHARAILKAGRRVADPSLIA